MNVIDLFFVSGECSGDLNGAYLIEALLEQRPDLKITAVAGPRMRTYPITTLIPMEQLQVMGFLDVVKALPKLAKIFYRVRNAILRLQPKAVICIDYPGFNLRLASSLKRKGYQGKVIQYICPKVWAWGKRRIPRMQKDLDLILALFPFEQKLPLPIAYVGHPLVNEIERNRPSKTEPILALFPGSRVAEVKKNFPFQKEAALRLKKLIPSLQVVVSCAQESLRPLLGDVFPIATHAYGLMRSARIALATSGTVTLELALHCVPTVVHYAIDPLDCFLAQKIFRINLPHYCLVNIIAQKKVFPEFFGPNLTVEVLIQEAFSLWNHAEECYRECEKVRDLLGTHNASKKAAEVIMNSLALNLKSFDGFDAAKTIKTFKVEC